jgi:hypothetical protein
MNKIALLLSAASLAFAAPASATTIVATTDADTANFQAVVNDSYVPTPDGTVTVKDDCPSGNRIGCSMERTIWIASHNPETSPMTGVFAHELGHVADHVIQTRLCGCNDDTGTSWVRDQFEEIMGYSSSEWAPAGKGGSAPRPNEAFADVFESCAVEGLTSDGTVKTLEYHYALSSGQYARSCQLIAEAAGRTPKGPIAVPFYLKDPTPEPVAAPKPVRHRHCRHHHRTTRTRRTW